MLGGDLEVEVWQRDLSAEEQAALAEYGAISGGTRMQAMAVAGENAAPVELKAVDARWPLYGDPDAEGRPQCRRTASGRGVAGAGRNATGSALPSATRFQLGTQQVVAAASSTTNPTG